MGETSRSGVGSSGPLAFIGMMLFAVVFAGAAFYFTHRLAVVSAVLAFRHHELQIIGFFTNCYDELDQSVLEANVSRIGIASLLRLGSTIGEIYNIPGAVLLTVLAGAVFFWAPCQGFRSKILTLDELILSLDNKFRYARAFVGRKRLLRNPEWGQAPRPGDLSLHPAEWIAAYARDEQGVYHDDRARAAFERQLGPLWSGVPAAAPHVRCLFAAFALHADRQRADAGSFLGDLATSLPSGNGDTSLVLSEQVVSMADRILQDFDMVRACLLVAAGHAYTTTAMMGVLRYARERAGVLSPGQFNWLKLVDRALWYALLMPPNPFVEGAGAQVHFAAETTARAPLFSAHVEPALEAIRAQKHQVAAAAQRRF